MSGAGRMYGGFVQVDRAGVPLELRADDRATRKKRFGSCVYDIGRLQKVNEQQCGWEATFQSCNDSVVMSWRRGWSLFWVAGKLRAREVGVWRPASQLHAFNLFSITTHVEPLSVITIVLMISLRYNAG